MLRRMRFPLRATVIIQRPLRCLQLRRYPWARLLAFLVGPVPGAAAATTLPPSPPRRSSDNYIVFKKSIKLIDEIEELNS